MMSGNEFVRYSLFEEQGQRDVPTMIFEQLSMALIWLARSGAPWRDLPERYGKWNTVYKCFAKWQKHGIFEKIFHELRIEADLQDISIDSTSCKAHQHSAGAKKGELTVM